VFLWNNLLSGINASSSVAILKTKLYIYYTKKLNTVFDMDIDLERGKLCVASVVRKYVGMYSHSS
jgi:hypothetical protein